MAFTDVISESIRFSINQDLKLKLYRRQLSLSGWLFSTEHPDFIHGLRVRAGRRTFVAKRKKRSRSAAAAYGACPWAGQNGYTVDIVLPIECREIRFEYRQAGGQWQNLRTVPIKLSKWAVLSDMGFPNAAKAVQDASEQNRILRQSVLNLPDLSRSTGLHAASVKRVRIYACTGCNEFVLEIARLIHSGFEEAQVCSELVYDALPLGAEVDGVVQIVVTGHEYLTHMKSIHGFAEAEILRSFSKAYILSAEQPYTQWFYQTLNISKHALGILDISSVSCEAYLGMGGDVMHFPLGYHPSLAEGEILPFSERTNEILFIGSNSEHRNNVLGGISSWLSSYSHLLFIAPLEVQKVEADPLYVASSLRNEALANTKLVLNIHAGTASYFEWHRFLVAIAHGCVVLTESSEGHTPLVPFRHFVPSTVSCFSKVCEVLLNDEDLMETISRDTLTLVKEKLRMSHTCHAFLQQIHDSGLRPPVESVSIRAKPSHGFAEVHKRLLHQVLLYSSRRILASFLDDIRSLSRGLTRFARAENYRSPVLSLEQEKQAMKASYGKRKHWLEQNQPVHASISNSHFDNPDGPPVISVTISLFNYARYILECLSSLEECSLTDGCFEVVVVDDASTDGSVDIVTRWMNRTHLPVRLIKNHQNTGVAVARNDGIENSRGQYVFVLDADNVVMPHCLQSHLDCLRGTPDAQAAYGISREFREEPSESCGLVSQYGWSPAFLTVRPYIDATAMFRRDMLIQIGGYETEMYQHGWFGWEDYELWLRMADRGVKVVAIPSICTSYRRHMKAMSQTTNREIRGISGYLLKRYSHLLDTPLRKQYPRDALVFGMDHQRRH